MCTELCRLVLCMDVLCKNPPRSHLPNESTNIDSPGKHPHSEYDVGENLGLVMDHYVNGRVIISCFSSQISRIELILKEAAARGRKVAFSGFSMITSHSSSRFSFLGAGLSLLCASLPPGSASLDHPSPLYPLCLCLSLLLSLSFSLTPPEVQRFG